MAKQLQLRRGTTVQNDAFTGAVGELTMDTDTGALRVHDGQTQGGIPLARQVMPDYSTGVSATEGVEYTATENCYLYARVFCTASGSGQHIEKQIIINGVVVAQPRAFNYCADSIMVPCAKGSTYKFENVNTGVGSYDFIVYRCIGG